MRTLLLAALAVVAAASMGVAATVRAPVQLTTRSCCEDCNVARYRPQNVPVVPATMVTGALIVESLVAAAGLLALGAARRRRDARAPEAEAVEA